MSGRFFTACAVMLSVTMGFTQLPILAAERSDTVSQDETVLTVSADQDNAGQEDYICDYHAIPYDPEILEAARADETSDGIEAAGEVFPSSYNAGHDSSYVLSPNDQNPTGECWAYSTASAAATSLLVNGVFSLDNAEQARLSPAQLAYNMYNNDGADPLGLTAGDTTDLCGSNNDSKWASAGGNVEMLIREMATWKSPAAYSGESSAATGYEASAATKGHIAGAERAIINGENDSSEIKSLVMKYGSAVISMKFHTNATSNVYGDINGNDAFYLKYSDWDQTTNHAVTIVGWNDDYSRDNFGSTNYTAKPDANGAWLVKNSWGTNWGDGGYFWLSYEDASVCGKTEEPVIAISMDAVDKYDNNYQYDGSSGTQYISARVIANVYKAQANASGAERLKAVSFFTESEGGSFDVSVYKLAGADSAPASGTLVSHVDNYTSPLKMAGLYTVPLSQPVNLKEGEYFSVVISSDNNVYYDVDSSFEWSWVKGVSSTKADQSYYGYSLSGLSDLTAWDSSFAARIKAYTCNITEAESVPKVISANDIKLVQSSFTYDGTERKPDVTVTFNGSTLKKGTDYTVTYSNDVNAGTAEAEITAINDYSGGGSVSYTILPAQFSQCTVQPQAGYQSVAYTGSAHDIGVSVSFNGLPVNAAYYKITGYKDNVDVGTATVAVQGQGNFTGDNKTSFTITGRNIADSDIEAAIGEQSYTGEAVTPDAVVKDGLNGKTLVKGTDYEMTYSDNTDQGTAAATVSGIGNYSGSRIVKFEIAAYAVSIAAASYTYTGMAITPQVTVRYGAAVLKSGTDYKVVYSSNIDVGTALAKVSGMTGVYSRSISFDIAPMPVSNTEFSEIADQYRTGNALTPKVELINPNTGKSLTEGTDYTVQYADNTDAGTAKVTVTGIGNYTGTAAAEFNIYETEQYELSEAQIKALSKRKVSIQSGRINFARNENGTVTRSLYARGFSSGEELKLSGVDITFADNALTETGAVDAEFDNTAQVLKIDYDALKGMYSKKAYCNIVLTGYVMTDSGEVALKPLTVRVLLTGRPPVVSYRASGRIRTAKADPLMTFTGTVRNMNGATISGASIVKVTKGRNDLTDDDIFSLTCSGNVLTVRPVSENRLANGTYRVTVATDIKGTVNTTVTTAVNVGVTLHRPITVSYRAAGSIDRNDVSSAVTLTGTVRNVDAETISRAYLTDLKFKNETADSSLFAVQLNEGIISITAADSSRLQAGTYRAVLAAEITGKENTVCSRVIKIRVK